ncbi:MAG: 3-keto-disaccharide hydrolase [Planctomycetota bacterium]
MKINKINCKTQTILFLFLCAAVLVLLPGRAARAGEDGWTKLGADAWHNSDKWNVVGNATLNPDNIRRLVGKAGDGVLINGKEGKCPSLVTKWRDYRDVEVHLEFMVAKGSNSGVIFHGNYEIQILDSYGIKKPTAGHCGGVYPRAESKPTYHHIDKGSPPRINAAKLPGQWQTMDIIFQAARFNEAGKKTAHARFVKVVHNGKVIQEDVEVPYACGPNWDRKQYPQGPIIFQGDYGPIALRNVRVRSYKAGAEHMPVPPEDFTALFNGRDLTGWHTPPLVKEYWSIEDGILKSPGLIKHWGASLSTKKHYRDFILMLDFRMPTISDSGINFRRLIPEIPGFGDMEQFNLRSRGGMGHLESYYFLPKETAKKMGLKEQEKPHVRHIDPEIGLWHTVKLTMKGRTFSAEYDGEVLYDKFEFHDWMMNMEPAPIRLQKHIVVHGDNLGKENPCPIEYRNIFIKEIKASE